MRQRGLGLCVGHRDGPRGPLCKGPGARYLGSNAQHRGMIPVESLAEAGGPCSWVKHGLIGAPTGQDSEQLSFFAILEMPFWEPVECQRYKVLEDGFCGLCAVRPQRGLQVISQLQNVARSGVPVRRPVERGEGDAKPTALVATRLVVGSHLLPGASGVLTREN